MARKKIRFALKLKDDVEARSLQELREAFDLNQIVAYFLDGKLETWLLDRYYEDLAEKISNLDKSDPELRKKLCKIFEVEYKDNSLSIEEIEERNYRIKKLKEVTDDEEIIKNVDKVAFCQEELADLLDEGQKTIYLCGTDFHIPVSKKGIRYIGVETKLDITQEEIKKYQANDIELIDLLEGYFDEFKEEFDDQMGAKTGLVDEMLKADRYVVAGNRLAGYVTGSNASAVVSEPTTSYVANNRPVVAPVQEDFGVFAPDKAESIDLPGITITLNGEKRFLSDYYYPYNLSSALLLYDEDTIKGKIPYAPKGAKLKFKINGHVVTDIFVFMHDKNNIVITAELNE